jgi:hypothetical protein
MFGTLGEFSSTRPEGYIQAMLTTMGSGEISNYDIGTLAGLTAMSFVFAQCVHGFLEWVAGELVHLAFAQDPSVRC